MKFDYIYLVSNTSDVYNNKLTDFKNSINDLYTRGNGVFEIALSEIILDDKFVSGVAPTSTNGGSFILSKKNPSEIDGVLHNEIDKAEKIFIPHAYYHTQTEICTIIDNQTKPLSSWFHDVKTNRKFLDTLKVQREMPLHLMQINITYMYFLILQKNSWVKSSSHQLKLV